jgi:hypothetical protein
MNAPLKKDIPNLRHEYGKIQKVHFGFGGYQDVQIGLYVTLGSDKGAWGVMASIEGGWSTHIEHSERCQWTEESRDKGYAKMLREVQEVLKKAKVDSVDKLLGKPIEATFDGMQLVDWRIMEEVL